MAPALDLVGCGPPLTLQEIESLEKEIGGQFPEDYKQFMLLHNGGGLKPLMTLARYGKDDVIAHFIRILPPDSMGGLRWSLERLRELNPAATEGFVPIASTFSEQEICLAVRGDNRGAVFHTAYMHEVLPNGDRVPIDVGMELLAESFTAFLDGLTEVPPPPYCRITELGTQGTAEDLAEFLAEGRAIDAPSRDGMTILCIAIRDDNLPMIRACLERGASLSHAMWMAAGNRRIHLFQVLLDAGADINERDELGKTPLDWVGGTALPGEDGEMNRKVEAALIKLGAVRTVNLPEPPPDLPSAWD